MSQSDQVKHSLQDIVALVPAAGSGDRLGLGPKAFLKLGEHSLLRVVVNHLSSCVGRILIGVPPGEEDRARAELNGLAEVFPGGATRHATIMTLFRQSTEEIIVIHDVARPFVSDELVRRVANSASSDGAAAAYLSPSLPVARIDGGLATELISKRCGGLFQTPLAFRRAVLSRVLQHALDQGIEDFTPFELAVLLKIPVRVIPGEETNIKITTPLDWQIATQIIAPSLGLARLE